MSEYDIYRQVQAEKAMRGFMVRAPVKPGGWERAGAMFGKKRQPNVGPTIACVCSHSKYHHTFIDGSETTSGRDAWGACIEKRTCGCEFYQEKEWPEGHVDVFA